MDFENLAQQRTAFMQTVTDELCKVLQAEATTPEQKIEIGKLLKEYSDSCFKAYLTSELTGMEDKTRNKMINQLDKLDRK